MNITFNRAYRVDALSLGDNIGLLSGDLSPVVMDTATFPVGSVYLQTDGTVWKRLTTASDGWVPVGIAVYRDGTLVSADVRSLNVVGYGVTVEDDGAGNITLRNPSPFCPFVLANATVICIPWVGQWEIPILLADGTTLSTLSMEF